MKKITFSLIALLCIFNQCTNRPDSDSYFQFDNKQNIYFNEINYPDLIGIAMQLVKFDSTIIVNDFHGDTLLNIFNINSNSIIKKLITKGSGPNQMISPLDIQKIGNRLHILCRPLFHLGYIPLNCIYDNEKTTIQGLTQLPPKSDRFLPLNDSIFILSGIWEKRYAMYRKKQIHTNDSIIEFGEFPNYWKEESNISSAAKAIFHQCQFTKHPTKNLFATCSNYVLDIFEFDPTGEKLPQNILRKQLGKYQYTFTDKDIITTQESENSSLAAMGISCSDKFIYIIQEANKANTASNILIIDWQGNPIKLLKSQKCITCIEIDERGKTGYCIITDPNDKLVSFSIN